MATFVGNAGDFLKERAIARRLNALAALVIVQAAVFFLLGFAAAKTSKWWIAGAVLILILATKLFERVLGKQIRMSRSDEDGASGERQLLHFLARLSDAYFVMSDLDYADSYGNIDHLVIGPTGLFAVDVKNWRGVVSAEGNGELLYNGRPTDKPQVRNYVRRVMDLRERLTVLTKLDLYIQCVFVFPRARVDVRWGESGAVHCIRAEQIEEYVAKGRGGKPIGISDISRIVAAAEALKNLASPFSVSGAGAPHAAPCIKT